MTLRPSLSRGMPLQILNTVQPLLMRTDELYQIISHFEPQKRRENGAVSLDLFFVTNGETYFDISDIGFYF